MCGIGAIYLKPHLHDSREAREAIVEKAIMQNLVQSNRGQVSAGLMSLRNLGQGEIGERLAPYVAPGSVEEAFHLRDSGWVDKFVKKTAGIAILDHVRYSTVYNSESDADALRAEAQPMKRAHSNPAKSFGMVYNGTLANNVELRKFLVEEKNQTFSTAVDTETLINLIAVAVREDMHSSSNINANLFDITKNLFQRLDGGYSIINLFADGRMFAFRGPEGIRPLKFGENNDLFAFASESPALEVLGIDKWYDVPRGGAIMIDKRGRIEQRQIISPDRLPREAMCRIEPIYFARGDSEWNGEKVSQIRRRLGEEIARGDPLLKRIAEEKIFLNDNVSTGFVIVPIPNTGRPYAEGYQLEVFRQTGVFVPLLNDIEKRFTGRMFISGAEERARLKRVGVALHGGVRDKDVISIDDSFIRGDTQEGMGERFVREGGARAFHSRIGDSPYSFPCCYGIDFPNPLKLAVHKYGLSHITDIDELEQKIAKKIGIASIRFQRLDGLYRALGRDKDSLCMACITGEYPTACGRKRCLES